MARSGQIPDIRWTNLPAGRCYVVTIDGSCTPATLAETAWQYARYARLAQCSVLEVRARGAGTCARFRVEVADCGTVRCTPDQARAA